MPRYFHSRKAKEIISFLEAHEFFIANRRGDDRIYAREGYNYTVKTPDKGNETIPRGTMSYILRCIGYCGIESPKKTVLKWWEENGYGA